jgi:hypothetical protein
MASSSGFFLSKWYYDCITDAGDAIVGYSASLRWKALSLEYSSYLIRRITGEIQTKAALQGGKPPLISGDSLRWDCPALKLIGIWHARQQPISHTVFGNSKTPLEWRCLQPHGEARISIDGLGTFNGFGYVDHLDLPDQPWQLPLDELRWGRYLSKEHSIIWMEFKGDFPETIVYHNGVLCTEARVSDHGVILSKEKGELTFEDTHVLRDGALVSTSLSVIPGINSLLPARMLNTRETKWRSRGIFTSGETILSTGWTIHEIVRWPSSNRP